MMTPQEQYIRWQSKRLEDPDLSAELNRIKGDEKEIHERFYADLDFGTAGLRGILGAGTYRMNIYTVRRATQGLADYLNKNWRNPNAAIAYDSRHKSELFAQEAAAVLAANGVTVHLYRELMPTPALSFAVRDLRCQTGIVVTASHNPAQYNGYKVYDETGCQIGPETAAEIMENIRRTDIFDGVRHVEFHEGVIHGEIRYIDEEVIQRYLAAVLRRQVNPGICRGAGLKIVYTPLNGAGRRCVLQTLQSLGVTDVTVVPEQEMPDGDFPTCPYPNPEIRQALQKGLDLAEKRNADLLLATDPDSDRCGTAVIRDGAARLISGNEMGVLLLDYICRSKLERGEMPKDPVAVKSIVSTGLADKVAAHYGVEMRSVLTGFKFIGEQIALLERHGQEGRFLLGFEESYGYLSGGYVRDKDAVNASLLICEMAAWYKKQGKTLGDAVDAMYAAYGFSLDKVDSYAFEGSDGMEKMASIMAALRADAPASLGGAAVSSVTDYREGVGALPPADVLQYRLGGAGWVIVRPSGTEPKLKVYYSLQAARREDAEALRERIRPDIEARVQE